MGDEVDPEYVSRLTDEYQAAREFADKAVKRAEELKSKLSTYVEKYGNPDDKGSLWLELGPISLKRERRVSKNLDVPAAEKWAKKNDVWNQVSEVVEQLNEDKLMALAWETDEYREGIADLYKERVVWAFRLVEEKSDQ
jgi:hypothetical protein